MIENLTISSLILSNLANSPLFTPSLSSNQQKFVFRNSQFFKSSSNFFYYSQNQLKTSKNLAKSIFLQIDQSGFNKFLKNVIKYSSVSQILHNHISNSNKDFSAKNFEKGYIIIKHSTFQSCKSQTINGSAISTTVPLELVNCDFMNCEGSYGACIFSTCPLLSISFSTFRNCKGIQQSGVLQMRQLHTIFNDKEMENSVSKGVHINCSLIFNVKSTLFASVYAYFKEYNKETERKYNHLSFSMSNCTRSRATSCVGILEATHCFTEVSYSLIKYCGADIHNGGIVLREAKSIDVNTCNFINLTHNSNEGISASVLLVYTCPDDSKIYRSYFIDNYNAISYTVTTQKGESIIIQDCIFSCPRFSAFHCDPEEISNDNLFITPSDPSFGFKKMKELKQRDIIYQKFLDDNNDNKEKALGSYHGFIIGYLSTRDKGRFIEKNNAIMIILVLSSTVVTLFGSICVAKFSIFLSKQIIIFRSTRFSKRKRQIIH